MSDTIDRLSICQRPPGRPVMTQVWGKLLFAHWPFAPDVVRSRLPPGLELDTHGGAAWVGLVPFTMWNIRPFGLPSLPGVGAFHELNLRTYVIANGVPGVFFFSLDAANSMAVWAARKFFRLPYFNAQISLKQEGDLIEYASHRTHRGFAPAELDMAWRIGEPLPRTEPGSRDFFLTERYCLYAAANGRVWRGRVAHPSWSLRSATIERFDSDVLESAGLPSPGCTPLVHYSESVPVEIFPLREV